MFSDLLSEDPGQMIMAAAQLLKISKKTSNPEERKEALAAILQDAGMTVEGFVSKTLKMSNALLDDMDHRITSVQGDLYSKRISVEASAQLNANLRVASHAIDLQMDLYKSFPGLTGLDQDAVDELTQRNRHLEEIGKSVPPYPPRASLIIEPVPR